MADEIKEITPDVEDDTPLEVTIKEKPKELQPSFDYDDYSPSEAEILDIEKEVKENIEKRTKHGT